MPAAGLGEKALATEFFALLEGSMDTRQATQMRASLQPSWVMCSIALGACATAAVPGAGSKPAPSRSRGDEIPGGITCLLRLQRLGVAHRTLRTLPGVITPVQVQGPIAGVAFVANGRLPLACDCRLVLALHRATAVLRAYGVQEVRYSNAYRRSRGRGRMSRHAMGLALDVHGFRVAGELLDVAAEFQTGHEAQHCAAAPGPLNAIACELRARGLFDRVLTPDTDAAHRDHLHLALLSFERRRVPARRRPYPVIVD